MIKEITIGGQLRPVSYGFNALAMFQDLTGLGLNQLSELRPESMTLKIMIQFAYVGLRDGARKSKIDFPFTTEDVGDWLDDDSAAFIHLFTEFVGSQQPEAVEGKKKAKAKASR